MPPQHKYDEAALLRELQDHNNFFDSVVNMIPAKLYVAGNTGESKFCETYWGHSCIDALYGCSVPCILFWNLTLALFVGDEAYNPKYFKGQHKESKESRRARNKAAKRQKFDPSLAETTRETKERIQKESEHVSKQDIVVDQEVTESTAMVTTSNEPSTPTPNSSNNASRVQALRAKLNAKIAELRAKRPQAASTVSKRAARRAEKQRRQQEAKNKKAFAQKSMKTTISLQKEAASSPLIADLERLDFGKLAGLNSRDKNKSLANMNKTKNLQKMLKDAQEKKERLEQLKSTQSEKAHDIMWGDTLKEASGERVKDDPNQIKKKLKQKAAKKAKSQKAWKSRTAAVSQQADERQKIRSHNLTQRKLGASVNLSKKRIVLEEGKPKRSRPGFEGRKQGFLNKGGKKSQQ